jgi:hypothetical protein
MAAIKKNENQVYLENSPFALLHIKDECVTVVISKGKGACRAKGEGQGS